MSENVYLCINRKGETIALVLSNGEDLEIAENPVLDAVTSTTLIDQHGVFMHMKAETPPSSSNTQKGNIGELAGKYILSVNGAIIDDSEDKSYDFQALDFPYRRIDAKFSSALNYSTRGDGEYEWEFGLASNGKRKDYAKSCDALICVGIEPDGDIVTFLIPSSVVGNKSKITIPLKWENSKYARYHYPLNVTSEEYLTRLACNRMGLNIGNEETDK